MFTTAANAAPRVLTGILVVLLALVVAKLIERALRRVLEKMRLDALLGRVGLGQILAQVGIRAPLSQVLPRICYYLLLFLFARAIIDTLGIAVLSQAMGAFLGYRPNLVAAILILVLGGAGGQVAGRAVANAAEESGIEYGSSLGTFVSSMILFISGIMALGQLQIDTDIVRIVTVCLLAGMALAFGLSFGLGTRQITRKLAAGFYARKVLRTGQQVEIQGERGVLKSITRDPHSSREGRPDGGDLQRGVPQGHHPAVKSGPTSAGAGAGCPGPGRPAAAWEGLARRAIPINTSVFNHLGPRPGQSSVRHGT